MKGSIDSYVSLCPTQKKNKTIVVPFADLLAHYAGIIIILHRVLIIRTTIGSTVVYLGSNIVLNVDVCCTN